MAEDDRFGRQMHKVTCSECGQETEVPFKPDGTRPVYCRECYQKRKKPYSGSGGGRSGGRGDRGY